MARGACLAVTKLDGLDASDFGQVSGIRPHGAGCSVAHERQFSSGLQHWV